MQTTSKGVHGRYVIATMIFTTIRLQGIALLNEYNSSGSLTCGFQAYVQWRILYGIIRVV
jgi:hypothetical protein